MKKLNLFLLIILMAGVLSNLITGCGGGGGGTGIVEPQATFTATVIAVTTTPTITTTPVASVTSTAVVSATAVITTTTKPTNTVSPTATSPSVTGKIMGMFSGSAVSGATITLGNNTTTSNSQGNFSINGTTGRMEISGSGHYTYSFPITSSSLEVFLVGSDMNNVSYSSYFIRGNSKRWLKIPKFRINENITAAQAAVIKNIIISELPGLTGGFMKVTETEILLTTATDPEQGEVVISMDSSATNSFAELSYSGNEIVAVRIVLRDEDLSLNDYSCRTIRHELGHMIGLNHPFDNLGWDSPDLPISIMNYVNDYKKYSLTYSDFDIITGTRKYNRGAGNQLPDYDPDTPLGKIKKITKIIL
ncbi:MAG: hypothetical protein ACOZAR_00675 [Patescibacteria group bacterium]